MECRKLDKREHDSTRALWERIFKEDTGRFLDYYYGRKAEENEIFVVEDEGLPRAMLQLNPYDVYLGERSAHVHYIVGVATDLKYRHRGLMRRLLQYSMEEMYDQGEPFTFLMPAAEAIYAPFGFRFVYEQRQGVLSLEAAAGAQVQAASLSADKCAYRSMRTEDIPLLVEFSEKILRERFQVYAKRDSHYYELLKEEQASENGDVILLFQNEELCGWFYYGVEGEAELREIVLWEGAEAPFMQAVAELLGGTYKTAKLLGISEQSGCYLSLSQEKRVPMIMARILHLEEFLSFFRAREPISLLLEVTDDILSANNGVFLWEADQVGSSARRIDRAKTEYMAEPDIGLTIAELTQLFFGQSVPSLSEKASKKLNSISFYDKIFLNEIV